MSLNDTSGVSSFPIIPAKTLVKAVISLDPPKPGKPSVGLERLCKDGVGRYIQIKAVIVGGQYNKRNLYASICTHPNGSEGHAVWAEGGKLTMKCLLEQIRNANKANAGLFRLAPDGVSGQPLIQAIAETINGREVIIKITEQEGKGGYEDSNSFTVIPKFDNKDALTKEFASFSQGGGLAQGPQTIAGQMPAPTGFGVNPGYNAAPQGQAFYQQPQPQQAPVNMNNGPAPSFVDASDDIPFDNN